MIAYSVKWLGYGLEDPWFEYRQEEEEILLLSQNRPDWHWGPSSLLFRRYRGSFPDVKRLGMKITTHLYLVPRLRMSGARSVLHLYAVMEWTGITLPFNSCRFRDGHLNAGASNLTEWFHGVDGRSAATWFVSECGIDWTGGSFIHVSWQWGNLGFRNWILEQTVPVSENGHTPGGWRVCRLRRHVLVC